MCNYLIWGLLVLHIVFFFLFFISFAFIPPTHKVYGLIALSGRDVDYC